MTLVAVYAAVDIIAEVKGICMRLAFKQTDDTGLGLLGSKFHEMVNLRRTIPTRSVILSEHEKFVSKHSICTISAETHNLDDIRPPLETCQQLLPMSLNSTSNIQSMRDLMYAFIKNEQRAEFTNVSTFQYPRGDEGFKFTVPTNKLHALYEALFKLDKDHHHHFARSKFSENWPSDCRTYLNSGDTPAQRMAMFTSTKQRNDKIRRAANKQRPTNYSTAVMPQKQQQQPPTSQPKPTPVQQQQQHQSNIPSEQLTNMYTSMSSMCKETCAAIKAHTPVLTAIVNRLTAQEQNLDKKCQQLDNQSQQLELLHQHLDEHQQQTALLQQQMAVRDQQHAEQMEMRERQHAEQMEKKDQQREEQFNALRQQMQEQQQKNSQQMQEQQQKNSQQIAQVHQQNHGLIQQVANLTKEINKVTQGLDDDIDYDNLNHDELLTAYLASHDNRAVEEFKEGDQPDDEFSTTSSSFSRDPTIAPCAAASNNKFIRRTEGRAAKDPGAPAATPPATAAKVDKACKAPAATTQPTKRTTTTDNTNTMMDYYTNSQASSTTTKTNDKSKLVPLKKKKATKFKSGQAITKAAQGRS